VRGAGKVVSGAVGSALGAPIMAGMPGFSVIVAAGGTARQCEKSGGQGHGFQQVSK
jgi:hypothetical protein